MSESTGIDGASAPNLTTAQSASLFDILTHHETYTEISGFKTPGAIYEYGPPFQSTAAKSCAPVLQTLLSKFVLPLPGLREVKTDFWTKRIEALIQELSEAELSESYDKGILGVRKTLATAISALIEYPARGVLGGFPKHDEDLKKEKREYDVSNAEDVLQSWQDCLQSLVYGDLIDELFTKAAETDDLQKHGSLVRGMHEFMVVNIASLMHYTLVLSPEGPTLLRMIDNVHRLLPYVVVRQTLKIGNVATMISAMMRVILAKVSVGSVTNWMGLSSGADEGMNLLQQIISQVLSWDKKDFRNRAEKIEKEKDAPPKAAREALKEWVEKRSRQEHEECRRMSKQQNRSIVAIILSLSSGPSADDLTDAQHTKALRLLSLRLSIRDRQEIVRVLCHRNPDLLTAAINDGVAAYTPMIRLVHQAVNLSDTVWDFERFVTDMLKMSKPTPPATKGGEPKMPTVEDYVDLLHRHQSSTHKFLHQVAKNGKEVTGWWRDYVHMACSQFQQNQQSETGTRQNLDKAFASLPSQDQEAIKIELDAHTTYLHDLHTASAARIASVIQRTQSTPFGPGAYLARWQDLLDETLITPATKEGPVRKGADKDVKEEGKKDELEGLSQTQVEKAIDRKMVRPPGRKRTVECLGKVFREEIRGG